MKSRIIVLLVALVGISQLAYGSKFPNEINKADTIEVQFGEKGTILIKVDSKEDLDALKEYDINSMLKDIDVPTEEELKEKENVILEDDQGTKYLKDSIEEDQEFRQLQNEFDTDNDDDGDEQNEYAYERKPKRFSGSKTTFVSAVDFGINNYLQDGNFPDDNNEQYTVRPWGSWYVAFMPTWQTHIAGKFALDYGAGISWYNFKFQDPRTMLVKGQDEVEFGQWGVELQSSKSKLTVAHLNAHFVPVLDFGYRASKRVYDDGFEQKRIRFRRNGFRIGAGAYVGTRIDSYQKLVWRGTGHKSKLRERDNFYINRLRYGARFLLGFSEVDIFVNYDMSTLFADDRGPKLNPITFGLSF
jgi:hypothetical protein